MAEALSVVQEVVDQVALVMRFLSVFAILAGVIILASSVAGTRFRRIREVVILKTLGGDAAENRRRIHGGVSDYRSGGRVNGRAAGQRFRQCDSHPEL